MLKIIDMWIDIKDDIFESVDDGNLTYLLRIIFEKPRGSLNYRANLVVNIGNIIDSEIFQGLSSTDQGLIEDSVKLFAYEENIDINYIISNADAECYNLEESITFLKEPLWIVLENSKNDSNFIKALIYHFDDDKKFLTDCLKNRWIDFANASGSGAKNQIKGKLESFDNLVAQYSTKNEKYYRGFVILDGDRDNPMQSQKSDYNNLILFLDSKGIKWHILEKRAMENYIPDEVLNQVGILKGLSRKSEDKNCIKWINVYKSLQDIQKNFLKFSGQSLFTDLDAETQNLYSDQQVTNYSILHNGISYRDNETVQLDEDERRFKNSFPKLFLTSPHVNKESLKNRCGNNELQTIYNSIKSLV